MFLYRWYRRIAVAKEIFYGNLYVHDCPGQCKAERVATSE
jgi:hypothetical protein